MRLHLPAIAAASPRPDRAPRRRPPRRPRSTAATRPDAPFALRIARGRPHADRACSCTSTSTATTARRASWSGAASFRLPAARRSSPGRTSSRPRAAVAAGAFRATGEPTAYYGANDDRHDHRDAPRQASAAASRTARTRRRSRSADRRPAPRARRAAAARCAGQARSAPGRVYARADLGRAADRDRSARATGARSTSLWISFDAPVPERRRVRDRRGAHATSRSRAAAASATAGPTSPTGRLEPSRTARRQRRRGRASGTFRVQVTDKDAAGATTDSCDTTQLRWTARSTQGRRRPSAPKDEIRVGACSSRPYGHILSRAHSPQAGRCA